MPSTPSQVLTLGICAATTLGILVRPLGWPEAVWSVAGALTLLAVGVIAAPDALHGIWSGLDVYLFLVGMMLLSEIARQEGLFEWIAAVATKYAKGSATRLFLLIYAVGAVVTIFLSNDATAVVLTPAVAAAVKKAKAERPLPYLFICAFIANAASFVLPISNPANLVIYGSHMPALGHWLPHFFLPSLASILATYGLLRFTQRSALTQAIEDDVVVPRLEPGALLAAAGIVLTAAALLATSALDFQLGTPTAIAGVATTVVVLLRGRKSPWSVVRSVSWEVLPLVAGLFVIVEGLQKTGIVGAIRGALQAASADSSSRAAWASGAIVALASNVMNNLPAGLIAGSAVQSAHAPENVTSAILIGVDLGPNLSVTGSLATILWLTALRREGQNVSAGAFLKLGMVVMIPALALTLAALLLVR